MFYIIFYAFLLFSYNVEEESNIIAEAEFENYNRKNEHGYDYTENLRNEPAFSQHCYIDDTSPTASQVSLTDCIEENPFYFSELNTSTCGITSNLHIVYSDVNLNSSSKDKVIPDGLTNQQLWSPSSDVFLQFPSASILLSPSNLSLSSFLNSSLDFNTLNSESGPAM